VKDPRLNATTSTNIDYLQKLLSNRHEPVTIYKFGHELGNVDKNRTAKRLNSADCTTKSAAHYSYESSQTQQKATRILSISESSRKDSVSSPAASGPTTKSGHLTNLSKNNNNIKLASSRVKSEDETDNLFVTEPDSDSSTGSLIKQQRSLKVQHSSSRLSISSIKEECVLSTSDAENVLPGSALASPTAIANQAASMTNRSLEERIKMLDEMMDKQQKNKLDGPGSGASGASTTSSKLAANSHVSSLTNLSTAGKANKLSKLFDLDEQRLQSAAIIHVSRRRRRLLYSPQFFILNKTKPFFCIGYGKGQST
jgi:hypothetical protein